MLTILDICIITEECGIIEIVLEQNSLEGNVTILLEKLCSKRKITNACFVCFKTNIFYLPEKLSVNTVETRAISYGY